VATIGLSLKYGTEEAADAAAALQRHCGMKVPLARRNRAVVGLATLTLVALYALMADMRFVRPRRG
jgi:hypothetical protein